MFKSLLQILTLLIFQLMAETAVSQENYLQGTIVNINGDTLLGYIDYRNWEKNPGIVRFKNTGNSEVTEYTPNNTQEFRVKDEVYVGAFVTIEGSSSEITRLEKNDSLRLETDTVFLQVINRGDKHLYFNKNKYGSENFYIKTLSGYELLVYKKYLKRYKGKKDGYKDDYVITENNMYLGQLRQYLINCNSISQKLEGTAYNKSSLSKLFDYYYTCTGEERTFKKNYEKVIVEKGILMGATLTFLKFTSEDNNFDYLTETNYEGSLNFSAGVYLNLVLPRNQRKWSIYNELIYVSSSFEGVHLDIVNDNNYTSTYTMLEWSYIKVNNMLRFKYPIEEFDIYINAGISNGFVIDETNYRNAVTYYYGSLNTIKREAFSSRKYEFGLVGGVGAEYKRLSLEARYERANGVSSAVLLGSATNRYYFLLGLRI